MNKKAIVSVAAFLVVFFGFSQTALAASVETFDTLAGFETLVKLRGFSDEMTVRVESPDGTKEDFSAPFSASKASFNLEIPGSFLRKAGQYQVEVENSDGDIEETASFEVFAGDPSAEVSGLYPLKDRAAANGNDFIPVTVRLQDEFGNPISDHEAVLLSSRAQDVIAYTDDEKTVTDEKGVLQFQISSLTSGQSVVTAMDKTSGVTLEKRIFVTFGSFRSPDSVGGDPKARFLALTDIPSTVPGPIVKKFKITELPDTVTMNENLNFKVKAVEAQGSVVPNYRGTVEFSSPTDQNAILPTSYTFREDDLGEHLFELSLSFKAAGKQKLVVKDADDEDVNGEKEVDVLPARPAGDSGGVRITQPTAGKYNTATLDIEGEAQASVNVNIFDNGQQIGVTRASANGRFSFTTPRLSDGPHVFSAESGGSLSEEVPVTIDATGSAVERLSFSPNPATPEATVRVTVTADPGLQTVSVTMEGIVVDLTESDGIPGSYEGVVTAPARPGNYPVDIALVDSSANETTDQEAGTLRVEEGLAAGGNATFRVPAKVEGVRAVSGDQSVLLAWQPSTDDTGISKYRVLYGIDRSNLNLSMNTNDASTQWEVRNLQNSIQYFFVVLGVDTEGNTGHQPSDIVGAVPGAEGGEEFGQLYSGYAGYPDNLPEDGPGIGMLFFSPFLAYAIQRVRRREKI